ncbi:hypothetical protein PHYSODRAFT_506307 [Plasmopara halstedii]|uniref:Uncharacterized protein n=1 Tax=Plasmopara halstedii TaxID=4781 RepID=A0A0P1AJD7_PLAHL|nr:hypothetical protein PHYSODRAFT_506307 [Plasmopara halstedii]CEG41453.1 hypothetical protein PHYSODRAFT_506307 [Plasmopara halstedii]|eukprot:XP_024577822.1 hypothetical protein PHYSODRAFT_506307 [Plasmopara halstedii]
MDTSSANIAFSYDNPFQYCIKSKQPAKYDWLPRDYNTEVAKFDRRTPGLSKDEWSGDTMVSLSSKNYISDLQDEFYRVEVSLKGILQKSGQTNGVLNSDGLEAVVRNRVTLRGTNKGCRLSKETKSIITYTENKTALNNYYDKRRVLDDGVTTEALDI